MCGLSEIGLLDLVRIFSESLFVTTLKLNIPIPVQLWLSKWICMYTITQGNRYKERVKGPEDLTQLSAYLISILFDLPWIYCHRFKAKSESEMVIA